MPVTSGKALHDAQRNTGQRKRKREPFPPCVLASPLEQEHSGQGPGPYEHALPVGRDRLPEKAKIDLQQGAQRHDNG